MEVVIGLGVALVAMALALQWHRRARPQRDARRVATVAASAQPTAAVAEREAEPPPALVWPEFRPQRARDLPPERQRQLLTTLVAVPRPSRLLDQLLSPEFINQASARQLAELVAGEPLLAARVLKAVNAPFYGLPQPVHSVAQAVTLLGVTTVRITCLRYIFIAAFKTSDPQRQLAIDQLWQASALASELMSRAATAVQLADAGRWSSAVLLSFLGRLAVLASAPAEHLPALCKGPVVQRMQAEQALMGLCAAELGQLLMTDWGLPATVVNDAVDIEWLLFDAPAGPADARGEALALCALCVRLSESAAAAAGAGGPVFDLETDTAHEIACLRVRMGGARRVAVRAWLLMPAVQAVLQARAPSA
jgi:HD-like signal output (HDOD) protein